MKSINFLFSLFCLLLFISCQDRKQIPSDSLSKNINNLFSKEIKQKTNIGDIGHIFGANSEYTLTSEGWIMQQRISENEGNVEIQKLLERYKSNYEFSRELNFKEASIGGFIDYPKALIIPFNTDLEKEIKILFSIPKLTLNENEKLEGIIHFSKIDSTDNDFEVELINIETNLPFFSGKVENGKVTSERVIASNFPNGVLADCGGCIAEGVVFTVLTSPCWWCAAGVASFYTGKCISKCKSSSSNERESSFLSSYKAELKKSNNSTLNRITDNFEESLVVLNSGENVKTIINPIKKSINSDTLSAFIISLNNKTNKNFKAIIKETEKSVLITDLNNEILGAFERENDKWKGSQNIASNPQVLKGCFSDCMAGQGYSGWAIPIKAIYIVGTLGVGALIDVGYCVGECE